MASGLATRCSACGTVFRVVPDQLRVSEGWVRCGRCAEVFNAAEALLDLETGNPRTVDGDPAPRAMVQFSSAAPQPPGAAGPEPKAAAEGRAGGALAPDRPAGAAAMPVVDDSASRFFAPDSADTTALDNTANAPGLARGSAAVINAPPPPGHATPLFLRQAERAARWRRPRVRLALGLVFCLATLGLAAQLVHEYRDLVAARYAATRPALQQACAWLGCTVEAAHLIDSLVVESSGLVRVEKSDIYRLSVALRNRAALEVAIPALELSLTDNQGKLVSRRVLRASELGVKPTTLGAGRELALQATLQARTAPVAGYTIELFYP